MGLTLAITGKGGVGKTTLAAMAVRWLSENGRGPVLAVDADPNTNLDVLLGVRISSAVGSVREEVRQIAQGLPASTGGMGKQELLELKIQQSLVETDRFDLLAMGRPEGPGCYCYANNVLGAAVRRLAGNYAAVVIDNEAGLENLSRRIVQRVDALLFVADASTRGLTTARRLYDLAEEMRIDAGTMGVVVNRVRGQAAATGADDPLDLANQLFENTRAPVVGSLPEDEEVIARDGAGEPIWTLPAANPLWKAAGGMFGKVMQP
ncbi:MAG TPA: AAA family ATPase [Phycisphaerae bacterium]|nr:AAA family ATPase [Phycisphaerae bacterium]